MATETTPRPETEEDLIARAPAHDGVATQRDVREMTHRIADRNDAGFGRLEAKLDRLTWLVVACLVMIAATLIGVIATLVAVLVRP